MIFFRLPLMAFGLLCVAFCQFSKAHAQPDQVQFTTDYIDSMLYIDPEWALLEYGKLGEVRLKEQDYAKYTHLLIRQSDALVFLDRYKQANVLLDSCRQIVLQKLDSSHKNMALVYHNIAKVFDFQNQFDSATHYYNLAIEISVDNPHMTPREMGMMYSSLGVVKHMQTKYKEAVELYLKGVSFKEKNEEDYSISREYGNLALAYVKLSQYELAEEYANKALTMKLKNYGEIHLSTAFSYFQIGFIYKAKRDYKKSVQYLKKGWNIRKELLPHNSKSVVALYSEFADCYSKDLQLDSAIYYANKSVEAYKNDYSYDSLVLTAGYRILARSYFQKAERLNDLTFQKISNQYLDTLALYSAFMNKDLLTKSLYQEQRAYNYKLASQYKDALQSCQQGIHLLSPSTSENDIYDTPNLDEYIHFKENLIDLLTLKARCLMDSINEPNEQLELLLDETFQGIDQLITNNILYSYDSDINLSTQPIYFNVYSRYSKFLVSRNRDASNEKALEVLEKMRDKNRSKYIHSAARKGELHEQENLVVTKIERLRSEILNETDSSIIAQLKDSVFQYKIDHNQIEEAIQNENALKFNLSRISTESSFISKISDILREDQVLLEYLIEEDEIKVFLVSQNGMIVKSELISSNFFQSLEQLKKQLSNPNLFQTTPDDLAKFIKTSSLLYNHLIAPIENEIVGKDLVIVPDNEIALIPFEVLIKSNQVPNPTTYNELDYLILNHSVAYANSITSLSYLIQDNRISNKNNLLALAPSFESISPSDNDSIRSNLSSLKWTQTEVRRIAPYFKGEEFYASEATENRFRSYAQDFNILHIASHAIVDDAHPMQSKIVFSQQDHNGNLDGYLHTFELFNMDLNSDLAVLSACNTGFGNVSKGEGVINLARGFFYAGCKSVVMSLWVANDQSSADLMESFYKNLAQGSNKDVALQQAKIDYLKNADGLKTHPYFWSQFVFNGNPKPISQRIQLSNMISYTILVLIGLLAVFMLLKKRSNRQSAKNSVV